MWALGNVKCLLVMVRHKSRWLLVQFEYESSVISRCTPNETSTRSSKKRKLNKSDSQHSSSSGTLFDEQIQINQITSTDIFRSLQETLTQNYGIIASSTTEISVKLYDPKVQLAIIKTSREKYPIVRSSLSLMFLTKVKQIKFVASTLSVSGSARTARSAA